VIRRGLRKFCLRNFQLITTVQNYTLVPDCAQFYNNRSDLLKRVTTKHTDKVVFVVHRQVSPAISIEAVARTPAVCHHGRLLRKVSLDDVDERWRVTFVVWTNCKKNISILTTDSSHNPLAFNVSPFIIFSFPKLALINFNCTSLAAD